MHCLLVCVRSMFIVSTERSDLKPKDYVLSSVIRSYMPKKTYTDDNPTGCCPRFKYKEWDKSKVTWKNKKFIKDSSINLFHIPLNMSQVITRMWRRITQAKAEPPTQEWVMLSYDPSPWKGEHFASVTKEVPGAENVTISGTFLTKVFEGPYNNVGKWIEEMEKYVADQDEKIKKLFFFYTTCPKCAKFYGKNYTVAFAQVD